MSGRASSGPWAWLVGAGRARSGRGRLGSAGRAWVVWAAVVLGAFAPGVVIPAAHAEEAAAEAKERALRAYKTGLDFYKREEWAKAIEQFDAGYKAAPQAVFLFNIAQAQNKAGNPEQALVYYRRYLSEAPSAPNRTDVEGRVAALERQLGPGATLPKLTLVPGVSGDGPEPGPEPLVATEVKSKRKAWPIVLGVLGGVVVVGAAVGLGVYFGTRQSAQVTVFEPVMQ